MKQQTTADIIADCDRVRREAFSRDPDRPASPRAVRRRQAQPIEVKRAKGRLRTAAWRKQADDLKRPQADVVASAFLDALVLMDGATDRDRVLKEMLVVDLLRETFASLEAAGYDPVQVQYVMQRRRDGLIRDRGCFATPSGP